MAYTKTLIGDITEKGVYNPNTVKLQEVSAICDTNFTAIQSMLTDTVGEVTADLVGAMVTGNTETGIAVSYQDTDNTLDFVVAYGTEPGAVSSSTSGQAGTADTASRGDHSHDLGTHTHVDATNGGAIAYSALSSIPSTFAPVVGTGATDACAGNDARLSDARTPSTTLAHAHTASAGDGAVLTGYQTDLTASSTLADLGMATIDPAFNGVLNGITTASTLLQLLTAIDDHTHV